MRLATFNGNLKTTITTCYSPTNVREETDLITFYNELSSLVCSIPKHNVLIISGDINVQISKNVSNKFSLHNFSNRNKEHLTDFTLKNRLTCLNTKFQKRNGNLETYTYTNNAKAQTDYILINKKWNNSILNCETHSSFEGVSSDHKIVTAKIQLNLQNDVARTTTTVHYDRSLLNNKDIRDKYTLTLRNKFNALQEISETPTPNNEYQNFINAHLEVAAECIATKQRAKPRVSGETLVVRKKACRHKNHFPTQYEGPNQYQCPKTLEGIKWTNIYLKEQTEYIQNQISKIRDTVEDRRSRIEWQTGNEVSRRKSIVRAKLKAASQEE